MGIEDLAKLPVSGFQPFIEHVRFPSFRNLQPGVSIKFDHPITVLVGPNGTNKSSILRSLQGCPDNNNIGNYWFDTDLDPIRESSANRYIHGYRLPSGQLAEVIKTRVNRADRNPDYFETSAPRVRDGMQKMPPLNATPQKDQDYRVGTRWRSIEKPVVYLDFRQEIPAYDIHFHFNWRGRSNNTLEKKKLVRRRAHHVRQALQNLEASHDLYRKNRILEPAVSLSQSEVSDVSKILGRKYSEVRLVKHDLFDVEGYTAQMKTPHLAYSEAFAGSGEFAAIMMVRGITQAPDRCLVLMDEPETSLHPGAQQELMNFVYDQMVKKKLQVVITTHSPAMVDRLPPGSLKILNLNEQTGNVELLGQSASAEEAFNRLGASFAPRTIFVEDDLAAQILIRASRLISPDFLRAIDVKVVPGGAGAIRSKLVPALPYSAPESVIFLDGDQRLTTDLKDPQTVPDGELELELTKAGVPLKAFANGGKDKSLGHLRKNQRTLLEWVYFRLRWLPGGNPEQLLLDFKGVPGLDGQQAKKFWINETFDDLGLVDGERVTASQILDTQRRFLATIDRSNPVMEGLCGQLKKLMAEK